MEYRHFVVSAFEIAPSKWDVKISRADGKRFKTSEGKIRTNALVIGAQKRTASDALLAAMAAIDRGFICLAEKTPIEKYWRHAPILARQR